MEAYVYTRIGVKKAEKNMLQIFKEFDLDGNGELSIDELRLGIKRCLEIDDFCEDDLAMMMDRFDKDGDGSITYEEFTA